MKVWEALYVSAVGLVMLWVMWITRRRRGDPRLSDVWYGREEEESGSDRLERFYERYERYLRGEITYEELHERRAGLAKFGTEEPHGDE